jgi:hypothetical protein
MKKKTHYDVRVIIIDKLLVRHLREKYYTSMAVHTCVIYFDV